MGLYRRDSSPYWWMCLSLPGRPTKRRSTKIPVHAPGANQRAELKRQAETFYANAQARLVIDGAGIGPKPSITVNAYLSWYEEHVAAHHRGEVRERSMLKRFREDLGSLLLSELTRERLFEWRTARAAGVSAATVNRELDVLKAALTQAVPQYLEASPAAGLPRLRITQRAETQVLSRGDEAKLLAVLAPADQAVIIAALDTLARAGDLLRLEWAHDHGRHLTIVTPKTGRSYSVPVSARLRRALDELPRRGPYVFWHRRTGETEKTRSNGLKQLIEDACRRARVAYGRGRGITFHGLRHTGATRLVEAGVDLRTVQDLGGWASMRMLTRYVHPSDARKVAAVEAIGGGVVLPFRKPA